MSTVAIVISIIGYIMIGLILIGVEVRFNYVDNTYVKLTGNKSEPLGSEKPFGKFLITIFWPIALALVIIAFLALCINCLVGFFFRGFRRLP